MKTLRDLAVRWLLTQRRYDVLREGRRRTDKAITSFIHADRQLLTATMVNKKNAPLATALLQMRAETLAELHSKLQALRDDAEAKDYDSYYEGMIDGLDTALTEIEELQKKDKPHE
jgi:hypothetical protein